MALADAFVGMSVIRHARHLGSRLIRRGAVAVNPVMMAHAVPLPRIWAVRGCGPSRPASPRRSAPVTILGMERHLQHAQRINDLVGAVGRNGDKAAFKELFDHFAPRVKGYLMRLGASAAVAEDLAQDVMLALWRKAFQFDPAKASASTWVFTIARNLRIDAIRKERRPEFDADDPTLAPWSERSSDENLDWAKAEERLREALVMLPREQAQVIELSFLADKPHSAIAAELGLPLGTVKSRIRLAMAQLRGALGVRS